MPHGGPHSTAQFFERTGRAGRFLGDTPSSLIPGRTRSGERVTLGGRQITGNQSVLRAGTQSRGAVDFSQLDFGFDRVQGATLEDINATDLFLSGGQQKDLRNIAKTASARGLRGGAVQGTLQAATDRLLAENRAKGFANVADRTGAALGELTQATGGFRRQLALLNQQFDQGQLTSILGAGTQDLRQFANPLMQALVAFGQERALTAGLALGQEANADVSQFGLSGQETQIARAVQQFLSPALTGEQQQFFQDNPRGPRQGQKRRTERQRAQAIAENRISAGNLLSDFVTAPRRELSGALQELRAGQAGISTFLSQGIAGGRQLTAADLRSQFRGAFGTATGGFRATPSVGGLNLAPIRTV